MPSARLIAGALVTLTASAAPSAASAAVVEHAATSGPAGEDYLVYQAGVNERNRLTIDSRRGRITFTDRGARISRTRHDPGGCRIGGRGHRATCRIDPATDLIVNLEDRADTVRFTGTNATSLGRTARGKSGGGEDYDQDEGQLFEHANIGGGGGDDTLTGTNGHDVLNGGPGRDRLDGGRGDDLILDVPDDSADTLLGGRGADTVDVARGDPVTIDLGAGTVAIRDETDTLDSIERAHGGSGNDTLIGSEDSDSLFGDSGNDVIDARGGDDYLSGDLGTPHYEDGEKPGVDALVGGAGDDTLDAREGGAFAPTDQLECGAGDDVVIARQDDLADGGCERSSFGVFSGDVYRVESVNASALSSVQPVARAIDGAPTYSIACPQDFFTRLPCSGRIELSSPPVTATGNEAIVLGLGFFSGLTRGANTDVPVVLTDAGKAALAHPDARVSVHVQMGRAAGTGTTGISADFGWQQVLP